MGLFGNMQRAPLSFQDVAPMFILSQQPQPNSYVQSVMQPMADPRSADLMAQQAKALQPGFFGKGGTGRNIGLSLLGGMFDGIAQRGGMTPGFATGQAQYRQQALAEQQRQQELADYAQKKNDALEQWKAQQQWQIDHPQPTDLQQNIGYLQTLDPNSEAYQVARLAMPGAGYSPDVLDARLANQRDLIDYRTDAAIRSKAAPSYSATHPTSLSARGVTTRRVGGRTYYNVGGKWYDNPEGR